MKKYRLGVWEEISGFIDILAESEEDARDKAQELIDEHGLERLFYGDSFPSSVGLRDQKHTHGMREVLDCEQVEEEPLKSKAELYDKIGVPFTGGFPVGNDADFGDRME